MRYCTMKMVLQTGLHKKTIVKRITLLLLCAVFISGAITPLNTSAQKSLPLREKFDQSSAEVITGSDRESEAPDYYTVENEYAAKGLKPVDNAKVVLGLDAVIRSNTGDIPAAAGVGGNPDRVLEWKDNYGWFEWRVEVPEDGLYEISVTYCPLRETETP